MPTKRMQTTQSCLPGGPLLSRGPGDYSQSVKVFRDVLPIVEQHSEELAQLETRARQVNCHFPCFEVGCTLNWTSYRRVNDQISGKTLDLSISLPRRVIRPGRVKSRLASGGNRAMELSVDDWYVEGDASTGSRLFNRD
ncbi:hypothetical protein ACLK1T_28340 [Escherichia coli]